MCGQGRAVSFANEDEAARFARQLLRRRAAAPKRIDVPYREVALAPQEASGASVSAIGGQGMVSGAQRRQIGFLERHSGL